MGTEQSRMRSHQPHALLSTECSKKPVWCTCWLPSNKTAVLHTGAFFFRIALWNLNAFLETMDHLQIFTRRLSVRQGYIGRLGWIRPNCTTVTIRTDLWPHLSFQEIRVRRDKQMENDKSHDEPAVLRKFISKTRPRNMVTSHHDVVRYD